MDLPGYGQGPVGLVAHQILLCIFFSPYEQPLDCPVSISNAILPLIELYEVSVSLFIQPVQVPSNGSPAIETVLNVWCSQTC